MDIFRIIVCVALFASQSLAQTGEVDGRNGFVRFLVVGSVKPLLDRYRKPQGRFNLVGEGPADFRIFVPLRSRAEGPGFDEDSACGWAKPKIKSKTQFKQEIEHNESKLHPELIQEISGYQARGLFMAHSPPQKNNKSQQYCISSKH